MKKIMYLSILGVMLLCENNVWFSIMDLSIDNSGEHISSENMKEIDDVNVKFRFTDLFNYIEKKLK